MSIRITAFIALLLISLTTPFPFFLFSAFLYVLRYTGYELLLIAFLVDATFGVHTTSFLYTLSVGALLVALEMIRPFLSWYTTRT